MVFRPHFRAAEVYVDEEKDDEKWRKVRRRGMEIEIIVKTIEQYLKEVFW